MCGDWSSGMSYAPGDVVLYNGNIYVAMAPPMPLPPDQETNWKLLSIVGPPGEVTQAGLDAALLTQTSRNVDAIAPLTGNPDLQAMKNKNNELIQALQHSA